MNELTAAQAIKLQEIATKHLKNIAGTSIFAVSDAGSYAAKVVKEFNDFLVSSSSDIGDTNGS